MAADAKVQADAQRQSVECSSPGPGPVNGPQDASLDLPEQLDFFSSFPYKGADSAELGKDTRPDEDSQIDSDNINMDNVFSGLDPERPYRDDDLTFLNFIEPSKDLYMLAQNTSHAVTPSTQSQLPQPNIPTFPAIHAEIHKSMSIPAHISAETLIQPRNV